MTTRTPAELSLLPGEYRISLKLRGYNTWSKKYIITDGTRTFIYACLTKKK